MSVLNKKYLLTYLLWNPSVYS